MIEKCREGTINICATNVCMTTRYNLDSNHWSHESIRHRLKRILALSGDDKSVHVLVHCTDVHCRTDELKYSFVQTCLDLMQRIGNYFLMRYACHTVTVLPLLRVMPLA